MSPTPDPGAGRLVARLRRLGLTLATSESLTGGLVGAALTSVPGASSVYRGGVVAYATAIKAELSGVPSAILEADGAVSQRTAIAMAAGIRRLAGADWAVATTGVAGPDRQEGHPPGTVWLGVAGPGVSLARRYRFDGDRAAVREQAVGAALALLSECLPAGPPDSPG